MDHKTSVTAIDEKLDAVHIESDTVSSTLSKEEPTPRNHRDITPKEQFAKLWAAIKAEKRFCWWGLYCMLLVFGWGYDSGLSGGL